MSDRTLPEDERTPVDLDRMEEFIASELDFEHYQRVKPMIAEITRLRLALRPFADAHHSATEFLTRCGDNHSVMESNGLYMWHAPRTLSASRFHAAVTALGEKL